METDFKEVFFHQYCKICKHKDKKEDEEPCCTCLEEFARYNSHKPAKWEERK